MPSHAPARRTTRAPLHHRRVSGPARPRAVPAVALPAPSRQRTGVFERLRGLPDQRVVDRLLRGRLCIWVIGAMLGGIVAMQVSLLRLNAGISRAVITADTLVRQNSDYEASIAKATSGDRVRAAAAADGMVDPPAGNARWLKARPATDAAQAVERMKPPSDQAITVMAGGGKLPNLAAAATSGAAAGTQAVTTATATATATPPPVPTVTQAAATPVPTATSVQTAPGTGAAIVPQG
jgi:hypothetical protein